MIKERPTIQQVKEHFKTAKIVKCLNDNLEYIYSQTAILKESFDSFWFNFEDKRNIKIWDETLGYAKIILEGVNERPVLEHMHTKGKWSLTDHPKWVVDSDNNVIAIMVSENLTKQIANAKLISISPELLQIAEMYFKQIEVMAKYNPETREQIKQLKEGRSIFDIPTKFKVSSFPICRAIHFGNTKKSNEFIGESNVKEQKEILEGVFKNLIEANEIKKQGHLKNAEGGSYNIEILKE